LRLLWLRISDDCLGLSYRTSSRVGRHGRVRGLRSGGAGGRVLVDGDIRAATRGRQAPRNEQTRKHSGTHELTPDRPDGQQLPYLD
jgi:hypothetical protein